ncbi:hypothetical protein Taro_031714 [Colocasia esculenta]|uniref:Uncharacterized protein n=1 Tax=Colocasia esculenta TaxID=4460 RepID=A0A843W1Q8_COLES|nr:hypothetical protein [Colocasia esculenta]
MNYGSSETDKEEGEQGTGDIMAGHARDRLLEILQAWRLDGEEYSRDQGALHSGMDEQKMWLKFLNVLLQFKNY